MFVGLIRAISIYGFFNDISHLRHLRDGQGEVYKHTKDYFDSKKGKKDVFPAVCKESIKRIINRSNIPKGTRKSNRMTKHPVRLKSWKGRR